MLSKVKDGAARALFPLLSKFHEVSGAKLSGVTSLQEDGCQVGLAFAFGSKFLVVRAEPESDTIAVTVESSGSEGMLVTQLEPWSNLRGKNFGWGWMTLNQQGYMDGVLLSFEDVVIPQIAITVVASRLRVRKCADA
jgi:hypothetical protein